MVINKDIQQNLPAGGFHPPDLCRTKGTLLLIGDNVTIKYIHFQNTYFREDKFSRRSILINFNHLWIFSKQPLKIEVNAAEPETQSFLVRQMLIQQEP